MMRIKPGKCFSYDVVNENDEVLASDFGNYSYAVDWIAAQKLRNGLN